MEKEEMIDVSNNRKMMAEITDNSIYGNISMMMKTQTTFAMGGAVVGFIFSVVRRTNWIPATVAGLILGASVGWIVGSLKNEDK